MYDPGDDRIFAVWQVLVLQLVQGVIGAFDTTARQAFVITLLDDRSTSSAAS